MGIIADGSAEPILVKKTGLDGASAHSRRFPNGIGEPLPPTDGLTQTDYAAWSLRVFCAGSSDTEPVVSERLSARASCPLSFGRP